MQASKEDINNIIKIKDTFLKLLVNKVSEIQKIMNNSVKKDKLKINMITKGPFWKQIIVSIGSNNSERVMAKANTHITNINRLLKRVKFTTSIDFIHADNKDILITTNNATSASDLNIIEKYIKELNNIDYDNIKSLHLPNWNHIWKFLAFLILLRTQISWFPLILLRVLSNWCIYSITLCLPPNYISLKHHLNQTWQSYGLTFGTSNAAWMQKCW